MKLPIETLQQVHQMLNAVPFLKTLTQPEIEELALSLNHRTFRKDETIIKQGDPGTSFHLMFKGTVGVYKVKFLSKKLLATLKPGDFFGEIALIEHVPRTATVIAAENGEMFTLTRESFEKVLLKNPQIGEIIRKIADARQAANTEV